MVLTPQRISTWVLGGVVLFAIVVTGVLVLKGRSVREPGDLPPSQADFHIKKVRLREQNESKLHWQLTADQGEVFQNLGKTLMRKVTITIREPHRTWTVTGEEGELLNATKDVEIRKNVVLISSDGLRLETERLSWRAEEQRVWTTDPVIIFREGAIIRGTGLDAWIAEDRTRVQGRLRATFADDVAVPKTSRRESHR